MEGNHINAKIEHEDIQKAASPLMMKNFHFSDIKVSFSGEKFESVKMNMSVSHEILENGSDKATVTVDIKSEPEGFYLSVSAEAIFTLKNEENLSESILIQRNTVAIMFPFIRSEITLLTSHPGMAPMVIPALNINKLLENKNYVQ